MRLNEDVGDRCAIAVGGLQASGARERAERVDERPVEMTAAHVTRQLVERVTGGQRRAIRPRGGDGVVGVGNGDNLRGDRNRITGERVAVAAAVVTLVVVSDYWPDCAQRSQVAAEALADGVCC